MVIYHELHSHGLKHISNTRHEFFWGIRGLNSFENQLFILITSIPVSHQWSIMGLIGIVGQDHWWLLPQQPAQCLPVLWKLVRSMEVSWSITDFFLNVLKPCSFFSNRLLPYSNGGQSIKNNDNSLWSLGNLQVFQYKYLVGYAIPGPEIFVS